MKKLLFGTGLTLMFFACTSETTDTKEKNDSKESISSEVKTEKTEEPSKEEVKVEEEVLSVELKQFSGNFFSVMHPENFIASPIAPVSTIEGVTSVDTDEAYFYAPDSSVVFFVFSPQWSGFPEDYMTKRENEKAGSTDKKESNEGLYNVITESGSFSDVDGKYQRAYVSITDVLEGDSETKKVFGIQYKDQASYDKYRDTYKAFKKSLKQFAD